MAKEEKHEVKRIEGIEAKKQTKSTARRFVETFIQEDVTDVGDYVLWDVVLPGIRTAIGDIWASIGDGLFGTSSRKNHVGTTGKLNNRTYVNYSKLTNKVSNDSRIERRSIYEYDEVILPDRGSAEQVLDALDDEIQAYGVVSVNDLYEMVGITGNYTDCKYGWTSLRQAGVERVRDGYLLHMPKPMPLD